MLVLYSRCIINRWHNHISLSAISDRHLFCHLKIRKNKTQQLFCLLWITYTSKSTIMTKLYSSFIVNVFKRLLLVFMPKNAFHLPTMKLTGESTSFLICSLHEKHASLDYFYQHSLINSHNTSVSISIC